jgi:orotate phosphoribosyltransferase
MSFQHSHSCYLGDVFKNIKTFENTLRTTKKKILEGLQDGVIEDFTHIAVSGVSGCTFGGALALRLKRNLIVVRKTLEQCHAENLVEGLPQGPFTYLFVDDFVSLGDTLRRVHKEIFCRNHLAKMTGCFQYYHNYNQFYPKAVMEELIQRNSNPQW